MVDKPTPCAWNSHHPRASGLFRVEYVKHIELVDLCADCAFNHSREARVDLIFSHTTDYVPPPPKPERPSIYVVKKIISRRPFRPLILEFGAKGQEGGRK